MSEKDLNLKERLRQALTSTIRVISEDLEITQDNKTNKKLKRNDFFNLFE